MRDENWARLKARQVIKDLKITDPLAISVEDIAWVKGALVREGGLQGCDARLISTPGIGPAILRVRSGLSPLGKRRFAIAHEVGHLILRHNPGRPTECADEQFASWYKNQVDQEVEANIFASELLMPEALFVPTSIGSSPSFELIERIADQFQTSLTATAIRYVELCQFRCAVVYSTSGRVAWCRPSPTFGYWIERWQKLKGNTYAVDFFERGMPSEQMQQIQELTRSAWIREASVLEGIKEQSRALTYYDSVITLLWIED